MHPKILTLQMPHNALDLQKYVEMIHCALLRKEFYSFLTKLQRTLPGGP